MTSKSTRAVRARKASRKAFEAAQCRADTLTAEYQRDAARKAALPAMPTIDDDVSEPAKARQRAATPGVTDELTARLERSYAARIRKAERDAARDRLNAKWRPWEGTPETNERIAKVPARRRQWPLDRMFQQGRVTADELAAANEIAGMVEMTERAVSVRSASLEARVDYAGSARDQLVESLGRIRLEVAYSVWRDAIPMPKRMIIDMLTSSQSYVALARRHGMQWRTARKRLLTAIRKWQTIRLEVNREVTADSVWATYARLGEGVLLPPKPKMDLREPVE